jgi:hypothetical protein
MKKADLEELKSTLVEAVREARSKPNSEPATPGVVQSKPGVVATKTPERSADRKLNRVLALVDDALYELGEGNEEVASDLLDEILDRYAEDNNDVED